MTFEEEERNYTVMDVTQFISIPFEVFNSSESDGLIFTSYRTPILFQIAPPTNQSTFDVETDTTVIGFSIANKTFTNLTNPVRFTLQSKRARQNMVSCSCFVSECMTTLKLFLYRIGQSQYACHGISMLSNLVSSNNY